MEGWSRRNHLDKSKLMMPLSFASILGGTCTLIGTSTNLIVYGMAKEKIPDLNLNIFEIGLAGIPILVVGIGYVMIFNFILPKFLKREIAEDKKPRLYTVQTIVHARSGLIGDTVGNASLEEIGGLKLREIQRGDVIIEEPSLDLELSEGDILRFTGIVEDMREVFEHDGLQVDAEGQFMKLTGESYPKFVEVVVSPSSRLAGKTPRESGFRTLYNSVIVAVHRPDVLVRVPVRDLILQGGDALLLRANNDFMKENEFDAEFALVAPVDSIEVPLKSKLKMLVALVIVVAMISVTSFEVTPLLGASLGAAILMLVTGCINTEQSWKSLRGNLLMIIAAAFSLGVALEVNGTAKAIAGTLVDIFSSIGDLGILFGLFFATSLLTSVISNGAVKKKKKSLLLISKYSISSFLDRLCHVPHCLRAHYYHQTNTQATHLHSHVCWICLF